jgi:hypothetical protein
MSFAEAHRYGGAFPSLERIFLIASGERPSLSASSAIVRSLPAEDELNIRLGPGVVLPRGLGECGTTHSPNELPSVVLDQIASQVHALDVFVDV